MTRKIETEMIAAIRSVLADKDFTGFYWNKGNTIVYQHKENGSNFGHSFFFRNTPGIEVIFHNTVIARIEPSTQRISFYSGGYYTKTTKSRINTIMQHFTDGFGLFQKNKEWVYSGRYDDKPKDFYEGLTLGLSI